MARKRSGRKSKSPPFVQLRFDLLDLPEYIGLSDKAKALLIDVLRQYDGFNNGDFCLTLSVMKKRGWVSNDTLRKAINELINADFLEMTRQGGRNKCNLYGVTWLERNECKGKLDLAPTAVPRKSLSFQK